MKQVNLIKNGFNRIPEKDFTDDGARFTAYEYEGIVITKTTYQGEYFISIRIPEGNYTYYDYKDKDWYKLADEFNGVYEVDVDKLIENIKIIKEEISKLQEEVASEKIDYTAYIIKGEEEIEEIKKVLKKLEAVNIMRITDWDIRNLHRYAKNLQQMTETIQNKITNPTRYGYQFYKDNGYVEYNKDQSFYKKEIERIINQ